MHPEPNTDPNAEPAKSATPRTDNDAFRIRWDADSGQYKVNIPNYAGGEVVDARDARQLETDLAEARAELAEAKKWLEGVHDVQDAPAADVACRIQFCDDEPIDCGEGFIDVKCWELAPDQSGTRYEDVKKADQARDTIKALREALEKMLVSATPNRRDNPAMHEAWELARQALASTQEDAP